MTYPNPCRRSNQKVYNETIEGDLIIHLNYLTAGSTEPAEVATEPLSQYYRVEDKFDFDNAGFTRTVDAKIKFLCCVDCSFGPFGWHDMETGKSYVALARVKQL